MPITTKIRRAQAPHSRYHTPNPVIAVYGRTAPACKLIRHGQSYVALTADDAFLGTLRTYTDAPRAVPVAAAGSHNRRPHLRNRSPPAGARKEQCAAKQMKWAAACARSFDQEIPY